MNQVTAKPVFEVRWHARGGQGAKTASVLLAEAVGSSGKYVQGFPEYGPERMGAPMLAFNRISDRPIRSHATVTEPDAVLILDPTLIGRTDVAQGLSPDGVVVVNTVEDPAEVRRKLRLDGRRVFTVDADGISQESIGKAIPNTPMMGAFIKATGLIDFDQFLEATRERLEEKFRSKPGAVEGNVRAIERAHREVRSE